jgi:hypothetical protein
VKEEADSRCHFPPLETPGSHNRHWRKVQAGHGTLNAREMNATGREMGKVRSKMKECDGLKGKEKQGKLQGKDDLDV